ncbi:MAG: methyltransferase domain-containing protein [Lautropia sp.]|nr:methyltransferase domain-containing protein [Lautropia sp.]
MSGCGNAIAQHAQRIAAWPGNPASHSGHSESLRAPPQTMHAAGSQASKKPAQARRSGCAMALRNETLRRAFMAIIGTDRAPILRTMLTAPDLDPSAVRRQFSRRAASPGSADFLFAEVEARMLERLDPVRLAPRSVIDVGCGAGRGLLALKKRYPAAELIGLDSALAMVRAARVALAPPQQGFFARLRARGEQPVARIVAADARALPLADSSVDLVWSNLALHWFEAPERALAEFHRVARPGALLQFSFFGVDTLAEVRALGARIMHFHDLHDVGDLLGAAGFAEPVMDSERLQLSWSDAGAMLADLRALGGNALRGRSRGLLGRAHRDAWLRALESLRRSDGRLQLTVELVFGHAWCPQRKRRGDGLAPIGFVQRSSIGRYPRGQ